MEEKKKKKKKLIAKGQTNQSTSDSLINLLAGCIQQKKKK
jgi:hypothetical protein